MSVVHQLSSGWLLDHLAFINNIDYQLCQHCEPTSNKTVPISSPHCGSLNVTSTLPVELSATSKVYELVTKPETDEREKNKVLMQKYTFRAELFNVTKPYVTTTDCIAFRQGNKVETQKNSSINSFNCENQECVKDEDSVCTVRKKNKRSIVFNQGELDAMEYHTKIRGLILDGTTQLVQEGLKSGLLCSLSEEQEIDNKTTPVELGSCGLAELCDMAKQLPLVDENELETVQSIDADISVPEQDVFSRITQNSSNFTKIIILMGQKYLLPPKSSFLLSDLSCMQPLLNYGEKYDVIVIDPPWQNKSVKRSKRYNYLSSWQIKQIPIPKLAAPNCLVITWVTNRQKHLQFVKEELYPYWSVETLTEWHWVKITRSGEFVFPLDSPHKKPYEGLVLGRVRRKMVSTLREPEMTVLPIPDHKLIVSVPCTLHSHKPPLTEVLKDYIVPDAKCLELFARNLQPGWTSWGNEVLKFQHVDYFITPETRN
ncbi:N(6)-adenine-specific methyltransferase METTL4 isoform X1 [Monodelphis domestica]|uniref:Methyltransferase 4, N6-adenosine n=1 Tax=Monodelphis domestica TaxID=13616 RepID=F7GDI0_MONDO|nr:N(6)-adenine-specific methyltransferase METTL4 isoform X1 [Monodelphis domestica]XP_056679737.1 N(6)-adenine-specific methyltransferase METTL4 isoform X1 [Monodelphis domestica]XP_056679739.1 N(6)-adenine-specific methyltransferase METTL4 isoform X1 [Monodelphis domestica]XP_056679740.1 N(6)-adenine-specific methyltransferase METTL4 isoform X1 [Monodelphis domestica]XP_056679741.1 N(6)-adenine-specific methyltransferase METTL4 isoform X1 [Monodelphis domestica]XP_056679742.1 N(6)-adenine-sp